MREPENRFIEYCGYKAPSSPKEVEFEILGLKNLIQKAKEKISLLEQTKFLVENSKSLRESSGEYIHSKNSKK